ncbi:MAG: VWA domain-containing protein, partial [Alphaproteobacteria bacterium]
MAADKKVPTAPTPSSSSSAEVDAFLRKVARAPAVHKSGERGRLIFAMDATASREPSWDRACHIQGEMFKET